MELGTGPLDVGIADPHPAVSAALADMIESRRGFRVAGCASTGPAVLDLLAGRPLSLLLLDQNLAGTGPHGPLPGGTLLSHIRTGYPALSIVVLAMRDDPLIKARTLAEGASAFLPKERIGDLLGHKLAAKAHGLGIGARERGNP